MNNEIYTRKEAAKFLRISVTTLDREVLRGNIDSTLAGNRRRFRQKHIEKYLSNNEIIN